MSYISGDDYYQAFKDLPNVIFPKAIACLTIESRQHLGDKLIAILRQYIEGS